MHYHSTYTVSCNFEDLGDFGAFAIFLSPLSASRKLLERTGVGGSSTMGVAIGVEKAIERGMTTWGAGSASTVMGFDHHERIQDSIILFTEKIFAFNTMSYGEDEPILVANPTRFTLFPITYPKLFELYKQHVAVFWSSEEIDLTKDLKDWVKLSSNEKNFIKNILAFFAGSDGVVMENIAAHFVSDVQIPEARQFYSVQMMMEAIHSESYSLLIDTYIDDKAEKLHLFQAIQTIPCVKQKADWALKWMASSESFATRLIAFAVVEGIFFSGSFCAIYWIKERGLMPGLTTSNEFIARDEGLHTTFACTLYQEIVKKIPQEKVHQIVQEAVEIEKRFITESLPCSLIGMNAGLMSQYIEFVADRLCSQLEYSKIYHTVNPFDFMERICLDGKDNFFEKRVSSYSKAGVGKTAKEMSFAMDADF